MRRSAGFAVELVAGRRTGIGMTKNASARGFLCMARGGFRLGDTVTIRFRDPHRRDQTLRVAGKIVRCAREMRAEVWPQELAVSLDEPLDADLVG